MLENPYRNWLTVPQAAAKLGLTPVRTWRLVRYKEIEAEQFGGTLWLLNPTSVEAYGATLAAKATSADKVEGAGTTC